MKNSIIVPIVLLILLSTISLKQNLKITEFNLLKIDIENNFLLKDKDVKKLLNSFYDKNLLFITNNQIKKALIKNSFIESFEVKKKFPDTLKVKIFEQKPIAILQNKKNKFYISESISLIEFKNFEKYKNLPYVFGDKENFEIFYNDLRQIDFPLNHIKKYTLYESNRWDLETENNKIIKLPIKNYKNSLDNYLNLIEKIDFEKYSVFDYRIEKQLILK